MKLILKKFLLIIFGIFLSFVILEFGLRIAGFAISSYQQYKNNKALQNKSQYTIMCLGESTTYEKYPVQLQKILDEKYPNKFSVIDCGVPGINLETLSLFLENNIKKYKPNIAICMMGINNTSDFIEHDINNFNISYLSLRKNLKTFNLISLMKIHILNLFRSNELNFQEKTNENEQQKEIKKLFSDGNYPEAINLSEKILKSRNDEIIYFYYCSSVFRYFAHVTENDSEKEILKQKWLNLAKQGIDKNFGFGRVFYYEITLFDLLYKEDDIEEAKNLIHKLIYNNNDIKILNDNLYNLIEPFLTEEQKEYIFQQIQKTNKISFYKFKITESLKNKNLAEFNEYCNKIENLRLFFPDKETYNLYKSVIKKLIDNNIKIICMQYPVRSIKPLEEQLKNEPYYDKITFISNENNFKDFLKKESYDEIFEDSFAGDFGHCTDLGNTMIAENIVKTLERDLDLKNNS